MKVPLFGDSLTLGRIGIPYARFLPVESEVRGIEGETFSAIIGRVERHLRRQAPPYLVIQGGGNDLLLASRGFILNPPHPPINNDEEFISLAAEAFNRLSTLSFETTFIVCSLPILGEELTSPLNQQRRERNRLLSQLTKGYHHFIYCDITTAGEAVIEAEQGSLDNHYFPSGLKDFTPDALAIGGDEGRAQRLSEERGLLLTVDGIHPNGRGARLIASPLAKLLVH